MGQCGADFLRRKAQRPAVAGGALVKIYKPDLSGTLPVYTPLASPRAGQYNHGHQPFHRESCRRPSGPRKPRPSATGTSRSMSSTCWRRCWNRKAAWRRPSCRRPDVNRRSRWRGASKRSSTACPRSPGPPARPDQIYVTRAPEPAAGRRPRTKPASSRTSTSRWSTCCWRRIDDRGAAGRLLKEFGLTRERLMQALREVRGSQRVTSQNPEATYEALERYGRDLTQARRAGQARPGDRPRRGDPPRHPGALAPHQEQPGADRRAGRGQDRHRRGAGPAHRARRRAGRARRTSASWRSTWAR